MKAEVGKPLCKAAPAPCKLEASFPRRSFAQCNVVPMTRGCMVVILRIKTMQPRGSHDC